VANTIPSKSKTKILYARGIKKDNYHFLKDLATKKGYANMSELLNIIIENVKKQEAKSQRSKNDSKEEKNR